MATYKAAVASIPFDVNSLASTLNTGGTLASVTLGLNDATFRPLAAGVPGLTSLTGIGTMYQDGQPYVAASATIGALRGA